MQTIDVQPPSLSFAAIPLREASDALHLVVDHRREVASMLERSPLVAEAMRRFLGAWELVGVGAAEDAMGLALFLEQSARTYVGVDNAVIRPGRVGH
ncbi:MAG: hypothetical protein QOF36_2298 [Microbacteriaceae bacterium]|nr:hypothetical protein [Microbacteriaceae bacterium]